MSRVLFLQIAGDKLEVSTLDQLVESANASMVIEIALWLKQLMFELQFSSNAPLQATHSVVR